MYIFFTRKMFLLDITILVQVVFTQTCFEMIELMILILT